jgi:hypothetical protein
MATTRNSEGVIGLFHKLNADKNVFLKIKNYSQTEVLLLPLLLLHISIIINNFVA